MHFIQLPSLPSPFSINISAILCQHHYFQLSPESIKAQSTRERTRERKICIKFRCIVSLDYWLKPFLPSVTNRICHRFTNGFRGMCMNECTIAPHSPNMKYANGFWISTPNETEVTHHSTRIVQAGFFQKDSLPCAHVWCVGSRVSDDDCRWILIPIPPPPRKNSLWTGYIAFKIPWYSILLISYH